MSNLPILLLLILFSNTASATESKWQVIISPVENSKIENFKSYIDPTKEFILPKIYDWNCKLDKINYRGKKKAYSWRTVWCKSEKKTISFFTGCSESSESTLSTVRLYADSSTKEGVTIQVIAQCNKS